MALITFLPTVFFSKMFLLYLFARSSIFLQRILKDSFRFISCALSVALLIIELVQAYQITPN